MANVPLREFIALNREGSSGTVRRWRRVGSPADQRRSVQVRCFWTNWSALRLGLSSSQEIT
jgi:hypothetical protein